MARPLLLCRRRPRQVEGNVPQHEAAAAAGTAAEAEAVAGTTEAAEAAAAVAGTKPAVPFTRRTSIHLTARHEHRDP